MEALLSAGIPHYHSCGGNAQCSTCRMLIIHEGIENLSACTEKEVALRQKILFARNIRLAYQSYVKGDGTRVHQMICVEVDIQMYIKKDTLTDLEYIGEEKQLALFFLDIRNLISI